MVQYLHFQILYIASPITSASRNNVFDIVPDLHVHYPEEADDYDFSIELLPRLGVEIIMAKTIKDGRILEGVFDTTSYILILTAIVLMSLTMSILMGGQFLDAFFNSFAILFRQDMILNPTKLNNEGKIFLIFLTVMIYFLNTMYCSVIVALLTTNIPVKMRLSPLIKRPIII